MIFLHEAVPSAGDLCPICHKPIKRRRKPHLLYNTPVCKRCKYRVANRRQLAFLIDAVIPSILSAIVSMAVALLAPIDSIAGDVLIWILFLAMFALFPLKDGFAGQSPGKWACGVQVVDAKTFQPISFGASFKRNVPLLALNMLVVLGMLLGALAFTLAAFFQLVFFLIIAHQLQSGHRWGDRMAGTRVIWKKHAHRPPFDPRGAFCLECGYNLTGNVSGRCPECATVVTLPPPPTPEAVAAPASPMENVSI